MARMPRLVVPGCAHHVTQRGARRQTTFFEDSDYAFYLRLVVEEKMQAGADILAYCLMPNHVHFVIVPEQRASLAMLFKNAHRRYTRRINERFDWRGHLWQERFFSCVMEERHLLACMRYVEMNPVRAGLCHEPDHWPWSSARAHLEGRDDLLTTAKPLGDRISDWRGYLNGPPPADFEVELRNHSRSGRPLGSDSFVKRLESLTGRKLRPGKAGRKSHGDSLLIQE